jgi:hypothetical protein
MIRKQESLKKAPSSSPKKPTITGKRGSQLEDELMMLVPELMGEKNADNNDLFSLGESEARSFGFDGGNGLGGLYVDEGRRASGLMGEFGGLMGQGRGEGVGWVQEDEESRWERKEFAD